MEALPETVEEGQLVACDGKLYQGTATQWEHRGAADETTTAAYAELIASLDRQAKLYLVKADRKFARDEAQSEIDSVFGAL